MRHRLISVTILTLLALSVIPGAFASTELAYDDGVPESGMAALGAYLAVKFSLPDGCTNAKLIKARVYNREAAGTLVNIHILGSDGVTELTPPFSYDVTINNAWNEIFLTPKDMTVTGDFWVAVEFLALGDSLLGLDMSSTAGHSYLGTPGSWDPLPENIMIRAVIECSNPVGGVAMAVNKPLVLAPYLALWGLVATVSALIVVKKRR